jgi:tetratricopeptide (TPR) repeat protein
MRPSTDQLYPLVARDGMLEGRQLPSLPREDALARTRLALHRTILLVDVERFGDHNRTNADQIVVRKALYRILRLALRRAGIAWDACHHEDRGDGVLILAPAELPKSPFADVLPVALATALRAHNTIPRVEQRIRLRVALHAGEVYFDEHGVTAASINFAFRLLEAPSFKQALSSSPGVLAVIASSWFFDEVIRHSTAGARDAFRPIQVTVKETTAVGWIWLPDQPLSGYDRHPVASPAQGATVPRQLPAVTRHFTGRAPELDALAALLTDDADTVVISAIDGTPGIGKTALALHWAHRVADRFADGQLYVNLRGFDPGGPPVTPADAIRGFLDAFEVPTERIPVGLTAQANLYRSLIAGRRMLVVLDNARDSDQVRPLLPGSPGNLVIVTSRNSLTSLIATEGAYPVTLDLLSAGESRELLVRRLGGQRVEAEPQAVLDIVAACARLPLALTIVAARATTHPRFPLAALANELGTARSRLDALDGGDVSTDMRGVLSWSYERLGTDAARMFRLLALHPGPHVTTPAAASMAGLPVERARSPLAELVRAHLLDGNNPGIFVCHDLLREYAREQALAVDSSEDRSAAVHRVLDHYLHTVRAAAELIQPGLDHVAFDRPQAGVAIREFLDHKDAVTWCEADHAVLVAAIQMAAAVGHHKHAWQLAWTLSEYLDRWGHWQDLCLVHQVALATVQRSDDLVGRAYSHGGLGRAFLRVGQDIDADRHLRIALGLFAKLGNQAGKAEVHIQFAWMLGRHGEPERALLHVQQALLLSRAIDSHLGQARALSNIGWYHALLGNAHHAIMYVRHGLAGSRKVGDLTGEAHALHNLGYAHHHLGHYARAIANYEQCLAVEPAGNSHFRRAMVLNNLAESHRISGNVQSARELWRAALEVLNRLGNPTGVGRGYPDTGEIRAKLTSLDD